MTRYSLGLLLFLLSACAAPPLTGPAPAQDLPTRWQTMGDGAAPDWAGLLDEQLAALQTQALRANRDIAQAALRWQQAQTQAALGDLRLTPNAGLNASGSHALERQGDARHVEVGGVNVPVPGNSGWSRSYGASVSVSYEFDLWQRLAHTNAAQQAQAEAARTDIAAARALIRARVAESYWTLAAIAEQRPLALQQQRINEELLQLITLRVREGKLLPIEIDKAAGALQQARVRLGDLDADARIQANTLALLLDQAPPGSPLPAPRLPGSSLPRWQLPAPAEVLAQRPDVQRARLGVDAALARLKASEAARYPQLSFSASASSGGTAWRDWLAQPLASLAANLSVPLIDWRRLDLQRDISRSELELAALALRDTLHKALAEIEAQASDAERLRQQLDANALRLQEAGRSEALARLRLEVGTVARADWLQTQSALLDAEQGRIQLRLRAWLAQAGLCKALGGAAGADNPGT